MYKGQLHYRGQHFFPLSLAVWVGEEWRLLVQSSKLGWMNFLPGIPSLAGGLCLSPWKLPASPGQWGTGRGLGFPSQPAAQNPLRQTCRFGSGISRGTGFLSPVVTAVTILTIPFPWLTYW